MSYKSVLQGYIPKDDGNFFQLYEVNNMQYALYSPYKGKVSCLELMNFKDISIFQLALYINNLSYDSKADEFEFEHTITSDDLINYLFDIETIHNDNSCESYISEKRGFVVGGMSVNKLRNVFIEDGNLLFDNELCYTSFVKNSEVDRYFVCFNPIVYRKMIDDDTSGTIFLLAGASDILLSQVIKPNKQINIVLDRDYLKCLQAFVFFLNKSKGDSVMSFYTNNKQVSVIFNSSFKDMEDVIIMSNEAEAFLRKMLQNDDISAVYLLEQVGDDCAIVFRNSDIIIKAFFLCLVNFDENTNLIF